MERVKNLEKVILRDDAVLAKIVEKKMKVDLVLPDSVKHDGLAEYIEVIATGEKVTRLEKGDIILDVGGEIQTFLINEDRYAIIYSGMIVLAVKKDNFDETIVGEDSGDLEV